MALNFDQAFINCYQNKSGDDLNADLIAHVAAASYQGILKTETEVHTEGMAWLAAPGNEVQSAWYNLWKELREDVEKVRDKQRECVAKEQAIIFTMLGFMLTICATLLTLILAVRLHCNVEIFVYATLICASTLLLIAISYKTRIIYKLQLSVKLQDQWYEEYGFRMTKLICQRDGFKIQEHDNFVSEANSFSARFKMILKNLIVILAATVLTIASLAYSMFIDTQCKKV